MKCKTLLILLICAASPFLLPSRAYTLSGPSDPANEAVEAALPAWGNDPEAFVIAMARMHGVDPQLALHIVEHESGFRSSVVGDENLICRRTGLPIRSRGWWQINDCAHPEVSDEVAFSLVSSTLWAMPRLATTPEIWTTYKSWKTSN